MTSDPLWSQLKSGTSGVEWPAASRGAPAALESLTRQLERSQWLSPAEIERAQFRQLRLLARHAQLHSPHFAERLRTAGLTADDLVSPGALRKLPLLTRRDLQSSGAALFCREVPADHLPVQDNGTSGSTGEPVVVRRTALCQLFWHACTMREFFWHERDFSLRFTAIRAHFPQLMLRPDWGPPASVLFDTGQSQLIPITFDIAEQVRLIAEFDPHVLMVYPNVLDGILQYCRTHDVRFRSLKLLRSISESLSPQRRERAEREWGVRVVDNYSSQEVGIIALQCADTEMYHVMGESLIVEVLDETGAPCGPGETGRVVITDLHNFATPIIRYEIGDYAQAGQPCGCGRGLPALQRIVGRERNLIRKPNGARHYPLVGFAQFRDVAPVVQYQVLQHTLHRLEVRLVTERPLSASEKSELQDVIATALGYRYEMTFSYFADRIPRGANGKFDEFVCLLEQPSH